MKLFISHRHADVDTAKRIDAALNGLINPEKATPSRSARHQIFLSERIRHGQNWLKQLHDELESSDYLVLIYTNPKDDWSWCMYEAGYFASLKETQVGKAREIYCLHHADLPGPNPLAHLQGTKVTPDEVAMFVDGLVNNIQIISVDSEKKKKAISEISDCFTQKDTSAYKAPSLTLTVKDKSNIRPWGDLADALPKGSCFSGSRSELSDIFQRGEDESQLSWAEAVEISLRFAKKTDSRAQFDIKWLAELVDIMHEAKEKSYRERPIGGLVFTGDKIYSPVIQEIAAHRDGSLSCEIIFLKSEGKEYQKAPESIRHLMISVRVSVRFRQEFLEVFKDIGRKARYEGRRGGAHRFRQRIWHAFYDVMTESMIRGLTIDVLSQAFNAAGRDILFQLSDEFADAQATLAELMGGNRDLSSSIIKENDAPFSDLEITSLDEVYRVFDESNLKFLAIAHIPLDEYFSSFASPERWQAIKSAVADVGPESADRRPLSPPPPMPTPPPPAPLPGTGNVVQMVDRRGP